MIIFHVTRALQDLAKRVEKIASDLCLRDVLHPQCYLFFLLVDFFLDLDRFLLADFFLELDRFPLADFFLDLDRFLLADFFLDFDRFLLADFFLDLDRFWLEDFFFFDIDRFLLADFFFDFERRLGGLEELLDARLGLGDFLSFSFGDGRLTLGEPRFFGVGDRLRLGDRFFFTEGDFLFFTEGDFRLREGDLRLRNGVGERRPRPRRLRLRLRLGDCEYLGGSTISQFAAKGRPRFSSKSTSNFTRTPGATPCRLMYALSLSPFAQLTCN